MFWAGIIIFIIGVLVRIIVRFKYYNDYKTNAHTDMQRSEMKAKYRPMIFTGLAIETVGCIIACISVFAFGSD